MLTFFSDQSIVEALYASNGNPIIDLLAIEGVKALSRALPDLIETPLDPEHAIKPCMGLGSVEFA